MNLTVAEGCRLPLPLLIGGLQSDVGDQSRHMQCEITGFVAGQVRGEAHLDEVLQCGCADHRVGWALAMTFFRGAVNPCLYSGITNTNESEDSMVLLHETVCEREYLRRIG